MQFFKSKDKPGMVVDQNLKIKSIFTSFNKENVKKIILERKWTKKELFFITISGIMTGAILALIR